MSRIITGLDIGSAQIKGVLAEEKKDGTLSIITAVKHPSAGVRRGVICDADDFVSVLHDLINDLKKVSRAAAKNIFVNVESEQIRVRTSRGTVAVARADREIQEDDIDKVVQASQTIKLLPNYMVLHNIVREFFVDEMGGISSPVGMNGSRLEVGTLLVEAFSPHVDLLLKSIRRAGGEIGGLIFSPLAAARSILSKKQKDLGVLMIDFGFGTTSMVVFEENRAMHAKSLPIGSGYVTNDIAIGLRIPIEAAEKLKLMYGYAVPKDIGRKDSIKLSEVDPGNPNEISRRFLSEIIEARLAELLELINNELKSLGRAAQLPAGVVITGGGVKLAGMEDLVRDELRLATKTGFPALAGFEVINPAHREMVDDPEFSVAMGLVLWGTEKEGRNYGGGIFDQVRSFFNNLRP